MLRQLQVAAHSVAKDGEKTNDHSILLMELLKTMQRFRAKVNEDFLGDVSCQNETHCGWSDILATASDLLQRTRKLTNSSCPSVEDLQKEREQDVLDEIRSAEIADTAFQWKSTRNKLVQLIRMLRDQEQSQYFQRSLLHTQRSVAQSSVYSLDNFAYGTTSYQTWLRIFSTPIVQAAINACRPSNNCGNGLRSEYTVFGSSTGSLVFFAALAFGIQCTGVELLPFLAQTADETQKQLQIPFCRTLCMDMLAYPLASTKVLLLTSQCWDMELTSLLRCKLERELPSAAVVIDYKEVTLGQSRSFRCVQQLTNQRVSWNPSQTLHIFEKSVSQPAE